MISLNNLNLIPADVIIYDLLGKEIFLKKLISSKTEISAGILERGIYFVKVMQGERQRVKKIVIE
jgi:hypothetical protein